MNEFITTVAEAVRQPWPWYVAGPLIGLFVPALLLAGNKLFGVSSNLRHTCAMAVPGRSEYFRYDWRARGGWNLTFAVGIVLGGLIAHTWMSSGAPIALTERARSAMASLGVTDFSGLVPQELFSWEVLRTWRGWVLLGGGGVLIGFGTAYAGGCTSGHAISGLADFQLPSLVAVVGFFAGGLLGTWVILPWLLGGLP